MLILTVLTISTCFIPTLSQTENCLVTNRYAYPELYSGSGYQHALHWSKAQISKPAPPFNGTAVVGGEFRRISLEDYKGKYLVLFFYPLDFTFVCPTEIIAFNDHLARFRDINTEVLACSVDSEYTHLAWINTPRADGGLGLVEIPILSDLSRQISKDYGVLLENEGYSLRGLFIIDGRGVLRQITMNDLPVGRSVEETLRLVQAFQFTDKHGEVCPAGWTPGGDTIVPNPSGKLRYFKKKCNGEEGLADEIDME